MSIAKALLEKIEASAGSEGSELFIIGYDKDGNRVIPESGASKYFNEYIEEVNGKLLPVGNWNRVVPALFMLQTDYSNKKFTNPTSVYLNGYNLSSRGIHKITDKKLIKELVDELNTTKKRTKVIDDVLKKMVNSIK